MFGPTVGEKTSTGPVENCLLSGVEAEFLHAARTLGAA
jgi:hypothetical protein